MGRLGSWFGILGDDEEADGGSLGVETAAGEECALRPDLWRIGMLVEAGVGVSSAQMAVRAAFNRLEAGTGMMYIIHFFQDLL